MSDPLLELEQYESDQKKETLDNKLKYVPHILDDPYDYFYQDEEEPEIDPSSDIVLNKENFSKFLQAQFKEIDETKKPYIAKAARFDPAFMVDPINEYYINRLPKKLIKSLSEDELAEVLSLEDPITWAERYLLQKHGGWKPRYSKDGIPYQSQIIRCKSKRLVVRAGRRVGKSAGIIVRILHRAFTWKSDGIKPNYNIVIFTPNQSQIKLLFKIMELFVDSHPMLISMVKNGKFPSIQQPNYIAELSNGVTIQGFVSGSSAIRGQAADMLILDEASFLTADDTDSVVSLINEHPNVELLVTSTPQGLKDWFYDRVHDPDYISFHFPSDRFHPFWSKKMEDEFRSNLTSAGYMHEVLAEFSPSGTGVFQYPFVEAAKIDSYTYADCKYNASCIYGVGVDWNDPDNGTQIRVVEFNPATSKYRCVASIAVHIKGWTQTQAMDYIKKINREWRPTFIYVDQGHGGTQIEMLHQHGMKAPVGSIDRRLIKVKGINFKSAIEVYDPWQKKKVRKDTKSFMVNNAVRLFENGLIEFPEEDEVLEKQLLGYKIDHFTPSGSPVYKADSKYGDHTLDAFMICMLGFTLETTTLGKPLVATNVVPANIGYSNPKQIEIQNKEQFLNNIDPYRNYRDAALAKDKAKEKKEYLAANKPSKLMGFGLLNMNKIERRQISNDSNKNHPFAKSNYGRTSRVKF